MLNISQFIDEIRPIKISTEKDKAKFLHIILCFDDDYALPAGVNIVSVVDNNRLGLFHFHLFVTSLSDDSVSKFSQIELSNSSITLYRVNQNFQVSKENSSSFPISACMRLIAPLFLNDIPRILYLDSDTLCVGNLSTLHNINLSDVIVGAVADVEKMQLAQCEKFNLELGSYFNSGVLYINTELWQKYHITERALELLNSTTHYKFPDQDVLNIIIKENKLLLDKKYNRITLLSIKGNEDRCLLDDSVMIHYTSGHKPWYRLFLTDIYAKYIQLSPWHSCKLLLANKNAPSTTRRYAKNLIKQHKYISSIRFYILYLVHKFHKNRT
ncbi:glycosyltransferase [Orbaceae bacterium ESL0721]|nr:glycosyltransferase [Orbaceae bacterium ESL0721]